MREPELRSPSFFRPISFFISLSGFGQPDYVKQFGIKGFIQAGFCHWQREASANVPVKAA